MDAHRDHRALVALAERIERESRGGSPVGGLLDELHDALVAVALQSPPSSSAASAARRMRGIVTQLTRDADGGKVRSISGLAAHARNLVTELERDDAASAVRGYALT
jgi:hypothetical protein